MTDSDLPPPIPAATLVLLRERDGGAPELLMMERSADMAFAAGALAFPGGRIDPGDHALGTRLRPDLDPLDAAARVAAMRETIEESGLAPGVSPLPDEAAIARIRTALLAETPLSALLDEHGLTLDLDALVPFARWCPTFREARRFDTFFYLARAATGGPAPTRNEAEAAQIHWASATQFLADIAAGEARAIFPTRRNLERLALFGTFDEAAADAAAHPVQCIMPHIEERAGIRWLCIPEDAGYPVTAELLETARRF